MSLKVLNIGGGYKDNRMPKYYDGWEHHILDIDSRYAPDVLCDAQELYKMKQYHKQYDSVYCSHNLEHYYVHKVPIVLEGIVNVLKDDGFVFIRVPDVYSAMQTMVKDDKNFDDIVYVLEGGEKLNFHDLIFGWSECVKVSEYCIHKCAFSRKTLGDAMISFGFPYTVVASLQGNFELIAIGFMKEPEEGRVESMMKLLPI